MPIAILASLEAIGGWFQESDPDSHFWLQDHRECLT